MVYSQYASFPETVYRYFPPCTLEAGSVGDCEKILLMLKSGMILLQSLSQIGTVQMRINFCGCYTFMSQHFLNSPEVSAAFYQMGCKGMTECMRGYSFFYSGFPD